MLTIAYQDYLSRYQMDNSAVIPERMFLAFLIKAECFLEDATMGRFSQIQDTEKGKHCVCEIAERFYKNAMRQGISQENNDGYSVSYSGASAEKDAGRIAQAYLSGTGLLYRGIG